MRPAFLVAETAVEAWVDQAVPAAVVAVIFVPDNFGLGFGPDLGSVATLPGSELPASVAPESPAAALADPVVPVAAARASLLDFPNPSLLRIDSFYAHKMVL